MSDNLLRHPNAPDTAGFWTHALAWAGSATPRTLPSVIAFTLFAVAATIVHEAWPGASIAIGPLEASGAVLAVLLVFRINAGYDRWWEARKLWGGIVNQSRNVVLSAIAYGPEDIRWRRDFTNWSAAFCHAARLSLRGETTSDELRRLIGDEACQAAVAAAHLPGFVALHMGLLLRDARERLGMDGFSFLQIDRERALLIDHIGACERILRTPVPRVATIKVRRFILLFLLLLPLGVVDWAGWVTPVVVALVAYPILELDLIGSELQRPFSRQALSHIALDDICAMIERNLMALHESSLAAPGVIGNGHDRQ